MKTYSDEYLEHWATLFCACKLHCLGIPFETFICNPAEILQSAADRLIDRLFAQQIEATQLEDEGERDHKGLPVELHGDHLMTPLHKRAASKNWKTNTNAGGAQ